MAKFTAEALTIKDTATSEVGTWGCANSDLKQQVLATQQRSHALTEAETAAGQVFNQQCDDLVTESQRWGQSNREVAALVEMEARSSTQAHDDVGSLRETYGQAHVRLQQETSGWGNSNRDVATQLRQLTENSAAMAAAQVTFTEEFAPQQQEALAHVTAWKHSDESVVREMQKLAKSTDATANEVECDRKAFVASSEAFVSAFTPQQAEAISNVAAWENSDTEVVEQMQQLAADTDTCNAKVTSDKDAFLASSTTFAKTFAPQQQEALAHVAAWKSSDESVVSEMQKLAESINDRSAQVGACAKQRDEQASAAAQVAAGVATRTQANLGAVQLELGREGNDGLKASLADSDKHARAKGDQLQQQVNSNARNTSEHRLYALVLMYTCTHTVLNAFYTFISHVWFHCTKFPQIHTRPFMLSSTLSTRRMHGVLRWRPASPRKAKRLRMASRHGRS